MHYLTLLMTMRKELDSCLIELNLHSIKRELRFKLVQKVLKICSSFVIMILKKKKSEKADQRNTFPFPFSCAL
jgi:hypothetical protein